MNIASFIEEYNKHLPPGLPNLTAEKLADWVKRRFFHGEPYCYADISKVYHRIAREEYDAKLLREYHEREEEASSAAEELGKEYGKTVGDWVAETQAAIDAGEIELEDKKSPKGVKLFSEDVRDLVWFVEDYPEMAWEERLKKWNRGHPEHPYRTALSMKNVYNRAKKKIRERSKTMVGGAVAPPI